MNVLIQLPYMLNSEHKIKQAEKRRKEIETQLRTSDYGIAYTDATEHILVSYSEIEDAPTIIESYKTERLE